MNYSINQLCITYSVSSFFSADTAASQEVEDSQSQKSEPDSVWNDKRIVYFGVALACGVIIALAGTIAVLHMQSIPKSDKNKERFNRLIAPIR